MQKEKMILYTKCRGMLSKARRRVLSRQWRSANTVTDVSIISSNCIGGLIYHDLGLRFLSPTIDLWMDAESFVVFCESLPYYLDIALTDVNWDAGIRYPIGRLDDSVKIYFQHYRSVSEAVRKWEERRKRVDIGHIVLIASDRDGMTDTLEKRFLALPYKKLLFVNEKRKVLTEECVYISGYEKDGQLPDLTEWVDFRGHRMYDQYFDFVAWLNSRVE